MKDEGGRMKGMLLNLDLLILNSTSFILHPSAFILALKPFPALLRTHNPAVPRGLESGQQFLI
jgi:hypothetical protein